MKVELENILDIGIPLIEPEDDRDYVDWNRVRDILITKNVI